MFDFVGVIIVAEKSFLPPLNPAGQISATVERGPSNCIEVIISLC